MLSRKDDQNVNYFYVDNKDIESLFKKNDVINDNYIRHKKVKINFENEDQLVLDNHFKSEFVHTS